MSKKHQEFRVTKLRAKIGGILNSLDYDALANIYIYSAEELEAQNKQANRKSWDAFKKYLRKHDKKDVPKADEGKPSEKDIWLLEAKVSSFVENIIRQQPSNTVFPHPSEIEKESSLSAFRQSFITHLSSYRLTEEETRRTIRFVTDFLESQEISDVKKITSQAIEAYLYSILENFETVKTAKNHKCAIQKFCEYLRYCGEISSNPAAEVILPKQDKYQVPVVLMDDEYTQVLEIAKSQDIYCEVVLALEAGLRRSELRNLTWGNVDIENQCIELFDQRGEVKRSVPMSPIVLEAIREQLERYVDFKYVFPGKSPGRGCDDWNQPKKRGDEWFAVYALKRIKKKVFRFSTVKKGDSRGGWNLLRNTCAVRLLRNGNTIQDVSAFMGLQVESVMRFLPLCDM